MLSIHYNSRVKSWANQKRYKITKMKLFINKYDRKGINFPSEKDDWKKFEKNKQTFVLNVLYSNEIIKAIMTMYSNTQAFVRSPDGDTKFFNIIAGVLQGDTFAPYLFIIVLDYVLRNLDQTKDLGFTLKKHLSRRNPAEMLTDIDFADDLALLSGKIGNAEKLLRILETAAASVGLYINTPKAKFIAVNTKWCLHSYVMGCN